ncbi:MAG: glycosyltransferase [Patescibacteria group bacterium]|nr:glycosyltransferase [Patescibacteria group bacterium]
MPLELGSANPDPEIEACNVVCSAHARIKEMLEQVEERQQQLLLLQVQAAGFTLNRLAEITSQEEYEKYIAERLTLAQQVSVARELTDLESMKGVLLGGGNLDVELVAMTNNMIQRIAVSGQLAGTPEYIRAVLEGLRNTAALRLRQNAEQQGGAGSLLPGQARILERGFERVAQLNAGELSPMQLECVLQRPDVTTLLEAAPYLLLQYRTPGEGEHRELSLVISREQGGENKAYRNDSKIILAGRAIEIPFETAPTHERQLEEFSRRLRGFVNVAQVYFRNGFEPAGGLEKVLREQAKILADFGYSVTLIGGNPPNEMYGRELLELFQHIVIDGAHERHPTALEIARKMESGSVPDKYQEHYDYLLNQLKDALKHMHIWIAHNPHVPRNPPFTAALLELWRNREAHKLKNARKLALWVHDVGPVMEPHKFPPLDEYGRYPEPWDSTFNQKLKGPDVTYFCVSKKVADQVGNIPLPPGKDEATFRAPDIVTIHHGHDVEAMISPYHELVRRIIPYIRRDRFKNVILQTGRIGDRKCQHRSITALRFLEDTQLIITGAPKMTNGVIDDQYWDYIKKLAKYFDVEDRIVFVYDIVGPIPDGGVYEKVTGQLAHLSEVVVVPSSSEGFGIDAANLAGVRIPIVATDDPALKEENLGDYATYVPTTADGIELATVIATVLKKPEVSRRREILARDWRGQMERALQYLGDSNGQVFEPNSESGYS